jgi:hypothetical protein
LIENYGLKDETEYSGNAFDSPVSLHSWKQGGYMIDKNELCEKIRSIYPDIGECGIAVQVEYDDAQKRWVVDLKKNGHQLKTYLEDGDAEKCLQGIQCVSLGIEIPQLRANIERM